MTRTFSDAYSICRPIAQRGDRAGATAMLCSLLWHVDRAHGGFIGRSDDELLEYCAADPRLDYQAAVASMYAPAPWPETNIIPFPIIPAAPTANQVASIPGGIR